MKLKYFLRGVGVGVIFGALIMMVAYLTSGASKLSDKEIIERAENLGMVKAEDMVITGPKEDTSEKDLTTESQEEVTTEAKGDVATQEIIQDTDVSLEEVVDDSINSTTEATTTENDAQTTTEATTETTSETTQSVNSDYVTAKISVTSGMTSSEVAMLLQDAGIIEDYLDFDDYLNQNGYSTQIRINDYEFNSNMTYQELAEALIKEDKQ